MRTILKFPTTELYFDASLNNVEPTAEDKIINVDATNSIIDYKQSLLYINGIADALPLFARKCEYSNIPFNEGYLVCGASICPKYVDEYCKATLNIESWDKFIYTEEIGDIKVYLSPTTRQMIADSDERFFVVDGIKIDKEWFLDITDATTDDSYYSEWEIDTDEPFYLANGINVNPNVD